MSRGKGRQRWRCRRCDKIAFGSESRAMETVDTLSIASTRQDKPQRAYPCPVGNGWHLTKEEVRAL